MKHKTLLLQRITSSIVIADQETADLFISGNFSAIGTLRELSTTVNTILRDALEGATTDSNLLAKGCYPLSRPENWDAVKYWLEDINEHYVPALKRAKEKQRENITSEQKESGG